MLILSACSQNNQNIKHQKITNLPVAVTNNAVALVNSKNGVELYSFNGLLEGKTWKDVNSLGFRYHDNKWNEISMPAKSKPVLASTAVSIVP